MPKATRAKESLTPAAKEALSQLGNNFAVARLRRKLSLKDWAQQLSITVPTLLRLEAGDPAVSLTVVMAALTAIGQASSLAKLAAPKDDLAALELDVQAAEELRFNRSQATRSARKGRTSKQVGLRRIINDSN